MGRILLVDDDTNLLDTYRRALRKLGNIDVATNGSMGLAKIEENLDNPYALIISDMKMPGMSGVSFLEQAAKLSPDTVRIMLTGYADLETSINAVNKGNIYRLLTKPCHNADLVQCVLGGIRQYELINSEKQLLKETFNGVIRIMVDLLSLANPQSFGQSNRIYQYSLQVAKELKLEDHWELPLAAMLSQVGCILIPQEVFDRARRGVKLTPKEQKALDTHPQVTQMLLRRIPRMRPVADIIALLNKPEEDEDTEIDPDAPISDNSEEMEEDFSVFASKILRTITEFDKLYFRSQKFSKSVEELRKRPDLYPPDIVAALKAVSINTERRKVVSVHVREMYSGMILAEDAVHPKGSLILSKNSEISHSILDLLKRRAAFGAVQEPIKVYIMDV